MKDTKLKGFDVELKGFDIDLEALNFELITDQTLKELIDKVKDIGADKPTPQILEELKK